MTSSEIGAPSRFCPRSENPSNPLILDQVGLKFVCEYDVGCKGEKTKQLCLIQYVCFGEIVCVNSMKQLTKLRYENGKSTV